MINEKEKDEQMKLISANQSYTEASTFSLIGKDPKAKEGGKKVNAKKIFLTVIPHSNKNDLSLTLFHRKKSLMDIALSSKSSFIKEYKEDEQRKEANSLLKKVVRTKGNLSPFSFPMNLRKSLTIESNDFDHHKLTPNDKLSQNIIGKNHRQLYKRDKICDTDTEDTASDNQTVKKWVILPDCLMKKIWNCIISVAILYSAIVTPYGIAFNDLNDIQPFEYFIDCIYISDIIINFFSAYTDKEDNLIKNQKKIIRTYLKTWFVPDVIAVFPFTAILSNSKFNQINKMTRLTKLPKFYRLLRLTKLIRITRISKKGNISSLTKALLEKLNLNSNIEKLLYFLLTFLLLSHLSTCIWYFVAKMEDLSPDSWVVRLGYIDSSNFQIYVLSFYWTLTTVTTVGYGDISAKTTPERIYNIFIMSCGVIMYSFAIGSLSSILSAMDQKTSEMSQKLQILSSIKKEYNLDQDLYDKVRKVIKFDLRRNQKDKIIFLQELPNKLRIELSQIMNDKIVEAFNFFKDQPNDFFAYVAPLLKPVKFSQNDFLYKCDDLTDEMYFVSKGTILFCLGKKYAEKEIREIKKSNNFGEIEMCLNEKLRFNVKVKSRSSELFILKKNDFLRLSVNFKEFIENFLHKSLVVYLKYNEDRMKFIEEFESLNPKGNLIQINHNKDSTVNNPRLSLKEEALRPKEDKAGDEAKLSNEEDKGEEEEEFIFNSDKEADSPKKNVRNDERKKKRRSTFIEAKHRTNRSTPKKSFIHEVIQEKLLSEIKIDNAFTAKFQKKIESIISYLEVNGVEFPHSKPNPKELLEELKNETSITTREEIINQIEDLLKSIYKD